MKLSKLSDVLVDLIDENYGSDDCQKYDDALMAVNHAVTIIKRVREYTGFIEGDEWEELLFDLADDRYADDEAVFDMMGGYYD